MSVSNEDRASAAATINAALLAAYESTDGRDAVDALIAHGWGPRPTVTAEDLTEMIRQARETGALYAYLGLVNLLRECGIEVTGD